MLQRLFLGLIGVLLSLSTSYGDSFGRFGYGPTGGLDDFKISLEGFWSTYPGASHFKFAVPAASFVPIATHSTAQTCQVNGDASLPKKVRTTLLGNSIDLYYASGVSLVCTSKNAPFLSWSERSVGPGVPTDDVKWLLVSFADPEPPLLFGLSGGTASFQVTGSPGAWTISAPDFTGWLRIWLPLGLEPQSASDAAGLGRIVKMVLDFQDIWQADAPTVKGVSVKANDSSVDATWEISGVGAFVPPAALLAQLGGSALQIKSDVRQMPSGPTQVPRAVVKGNELDIHFPCMRIKPGRALGLGSLPFEPIANASTIDIPSLVELANENLLAWGDSDLLKLADSTVTRFLTESTYVPEPNTSQQLPYSLDGSSIAVAAAQAYLAQCCSVAVGSVQPNALFDSILWRRDWWSWTIWNSDVNVSRQATALAALAGAMSQNSESRFYGATLEAGLDAQRGREIWDQRHGTRNPSETLTEPLLGLRTGFFLLTRMRDTTMDFYHLIQSPLKMDVGPAVTLFPEANDYLLEWKADELKTSSLAFVDPPSDPSAASPENIDKLVCAREKDNFKVRYLPSAIGTCTVKLAFRPQKLNIPKEVAPPAF